MPGRSAAQSRRSFHIPGVGGSVRPLFSVAVPIGYHSGGYKGVPVDGTVEIGYEIAPGFRRRGLAGAAAIALVDRVLGHGEVTRVTAHTPAGDAACGGVLRNAGFSVEARIEDPEHGAIERWVRTRSAN